MDSSLDQALTDKFLSTYSHLTSDLSTPPLDSEILSMVDQRLKLAGVIALSLTANGRSERNYAALLHLIGRCLSGDVQLSWGHTTESMCVGYMSHSHKKPTVSEHYVQLVESPSKEHFGPAM